MSFAAAGAKRTESFLVMWTGFDFRSWVDVEVETFVADGAIQGARIVVTFRHLPPLSYLSEFDENEGSGPYLLPTDYTRANTRMCHPFCISLSANVCTLHYRTTRTVAVLYACLDIYSLGGRALHEKLCNAVGSGPDQICVHF